MKIISLSDILVDKSPHYSVPRREMWDRHTPESDVDRRFVFYTVAHLFWEKVHYQNHKSVPIYVQDSVDGCIGELNLGDPAKKSYNEIRYRDLTRGNWDENGRLKCKVKIYRPSSRATIQKEQAVSNNDEFVDEFADVPTPPDDTEVFPIYYSVVSQIADNSERFLHIMAEFPSNPFNPSDWCGISDSGKAIFPVLRVPPGHDFYRHIPRGSSVVQPHLIRQSYPSQSGQDLSEHQIWMSSMDDEEWSDTIYNLDGDG